MKWRARCPGCGRSRWVDEAGGGPVLCSACGLRHNAPHPGGPTVLAVAPPADPTPDPPAVSAGPTTRVWAVVAIGAFLCGVLMAVGGVIVWETVRRPTAATTRPAVATRPSTAVRIATTRPTSVPSSRPRPKTVPASRPTKAHRKPAPATVAATEPAAVFHPVRSDVPADDLDDRIGRSITRGIDYLLAQFDARGRLGHYAGSDGEAGGADALAVYALLQSARATEDGRLGPTAPVTDELLRALKAIRMDQGRSTYGRSLRAQALGVYARLADRAAVEADAMWLMASGHDGAYTYDPLPKAVLQPIPGRRAGPGSLLGNGWWDNSNSQYGAYGVWAAQEAGVEVPNHYWEAVHKHWVACQLHDGQWGYTAGYGGGRASMTVAGVTSLLVAEDQLDLRSVVETLGHAPYTPAVARGLAWLEDGANSVTLPDDSWRTYNLYGLERAALASGFKRFGAHDWYRELATAALARQRPDGRWEDGDSVVDTSFTLLFLARGRHPLLMNKLRYDGAWANRPRDVANLTRFASRTLERSLNWQVVDVRNGWRDWSDAPVLFVSGHTTWAPTTATVDDLRSYAENGGLIFTHADGDAPAFSASVADVARRAFPAYPLTDVPATDPIYSTVFPLKPPVPQLQGVSNGSRWLLVHSPTDLNKVWQLHDWQNRPTPFQLGLNLFVDAAGKGRLRDRLQTTAVADPPGVAAVKTMRVARVKYAGNWDPEPAALSRAGRLLRVETGVRIEPVPTDPAALSAAEMPVAFLTGTAAVKLSDAEVAAIGRYVAGGGVLLVDACGGSADFLRSVQADVLPRAFPHNPPRPLPSDHPIRDGSGEGMTPLTDRLRPGAAERLAMTTSPLQYLVPGAGLVVVSPVDVTTGLLGTQTWGVNGYTPDGAYDLVRNVVLFSLERPVPGTRPTTRP